MVAIGCSTVSCDLILIREDSEKNYGKHMYAGRNIFVCSLVGIESMLRSFSSLNDHETNESVGAAYHLLPVLPTIYKNAAEGTSDIDDLLIVGSAVIDGVDSRGRELVPSAPEAWAAHLFLWIYVRDVIVAVESGRRTFESIITLNST
jgi:hypothetical protein